MVEALPPDSATARARVGHDWRHADYAAADTVDLLALLVTQFANAHRAEKEPPLPMPAPGWRPGDPLPEDTAAAEAEQRAAARAAYERINAKVLPRGG